MKLKVFENPQFGEIRTAGTSEEPLFCLTDVAKALEYSNPAKAVIDHCKGVTILETPTKGGVQKPLQREGDTTRVLFRQVRQSIVKPQASVNHGK